MANVVGNGVSRIIMDADGEQVTVTSNRLHTDALSEVQGHTAIISAGINVTDSGVQLASVACKQADIMANIANTGIVYIGGSNVSASTGIALYPGDMYSCDISTLALLYVLSTVDGDDINVLLLT